MLRHRRSGEKVNIRMIQRTTSETIRLEKTEVLLVNSAPVRPISATPLVKKCTSGSFQITGVSLTQKTIEAGDDSADDFEESRTDDISRQDNETPSLSEDTFSRDTEDYPPPPVSSNTSSNQVNTLANGLTVVPCSGDSSLTNCHITIDSELIRGISEIIIMDPRKTEENKTPTTTTCTASTSRSTSVATTASQPPTTRKIGGRFKFVKIESIVPFRRGRWECVDYLDNSIYAPKDAYVYHEHHYVRKSTLKKSTYTQANTTTSTITSYSQSPTYQVAADRYPNLFGNSSQTTPYANPGFPSTSGNLGGFNVSQPPQMMGDYNRQTSTPEPTYQLMPQQQQSQLHTVPPQSSSFTAIPQQHSHMSLPMYSASCPTFHNPPPTQVQAGANQYTPLPSTFPSMVYQSFQPVNVHHFFNEVPQTQTAQEFVFGGQGYSNIGAPGFNQYTQQSSYNIPNQTVGSMPPMQMYTTVQECTEQYMSMPPTPVSVPLTSMLSVVIPAVPAETMQPMQPPQTQQPQQLQQAPQSRQPLQIQQLPPTQQLPQTEQLRQIHQPVQLQQQPQLPQTQQPRQIQQVQLMQPPPQTSQPAQMQQQPQTQQVPQTQQPAQIQQRPQAQQLPQAQQPLQVHLLPQTQQLPQTQPQTQQPLQQHPPQQQPPRLVQQQSFVEQPNITEYGEPPTQAFTAPITNNLVQLKTQEREIRAVPQQQPPESLDVESREIDLPPEAPAAKQEPEKPPEVAENASAGDSAVVIDNKIEQAMDLVKSHLLYTVRAEVEVLKHRIAELLDRINQLEVENNFLRANAAPEVLTALNNGAAQTNTAGGQGQGQGPKGPTAGCSKQQ